jgi:hypothetical protein
METGRERRRKGVKKDGTMRGKTLDMRCSEGLREDDMFIYFIQ